MNLQHLFEAQAKLDARIEREHPRTENENRVPQKILALQVELGEMANEWRGFKFWSQDREPRTHKVRTVSDGYRLNVVPYNPLLEEAVDVLHFILSIGNELGFNQDYEMDNFLVPGTQEAFSDMFYRVSRFESDGEDYDYFQMLAHFIILTKSLNFTWDEIEKAYFAKNKINHQRQDGGY